MKVHELCSKYGVSGRTMASLLGVSAPTLIYWETNFNGDIPERFVDEVNLMTSSIDYVSSQTKIPSKKLMPLLVEFRKSPLWKGWEHYKLFMTEAEANNKTLETLKDRIYEHIEHSNQSVKPFNNLNEKVGNLSKIFSKSYKDKKGNLLGVIIFNKAISLPLILEELSAIEKVRAVFPESRFLMYAQKIENSVKFGLQEAEYIKLFEYEEHIDIKVKSIK